MVFKKKKTGFEGGGLALFDKVEEALHAEKVLKNAGYVYRLVAPPPALRKGCDLALEINLVEQMGIERLWKNKDVNCLEVVPLRGKSLELLRIVNITNWGDVVMVKAGNMKLSFDKETGIIQNTSGGGCPDIPYLHTQLLGKKLSEAPRPKDIGFTLCGLMLDRALEESQRLWREGSVSVVKGENHV